MQHSLFCVFHLHSVLCSLISKPGIYNHVHVMMCVFAQVRRSSDAGRTQASVAGVPGVVGRHVQQYYFTLLRFYFDFKPKFVVSLRRSQTHAGAIVGAKLATCLSC